MQTFPLIEEVTMLACEDAPAGGTVAEQCGGDGSALHASAVGAAGDAVKDHMEDVYFEAVKVSLLPVVSPPPPS